MAERQRALPPNEGAHMPDSVRDSLLGLYLDLVNELTEVQCIVRECVAPSPPLMYAKRDADMETPCPRNQGGEKRLAVRRHGAVSGNLVHLTNS